MPPFASGKWDARSHHGFLNADIVTPSKEVIVVKVPAIFRMIGIKEKYWRIYKALYGRGVSPKLWNLNRNKILRQVE